MQSNTPPEHARPVKLGRVVALLCVFNIAGILFYEPIEGLSTALSLAVFAVFYTFVAGVSFVVIWFFWRCHNWARLAVLATSVLALVNLLFITSVSRVAQLLIVAEAAFGAWLLYWLNAANVSGFFKRGSVSSQERQ